MSSLSPCTGAGVASRVGRRVFPVPTPALKKATAFLRLRCSLGSFLGRNSCLLTFLNHTNQGSVQDPRAHEAAGTNTDLSVPGGLELNPTDSTTGREEPDLGHKVTFYPSLDLMDMWLGASPLSSLGPRFSTCRVLCELTWRPHLAPARDIMTLLRQHCFGGSVQCMTQRSSLGTPGQSRRAGKEMRRKRGKGGEDRREVGGTLLLLSFPSTGASAARLPFSRSFSPGPREELLSGILMYSPHPRMH